MPDVRGCQVREKKKDICPHEDRTPIPSPGRLILTHAKTRRREVVQEFISALLLGLPEYLNDLNAMNESSAPFGRESYSDVEFTKGLSTICHKSSVPFGRESYSDAAPHDQALISETESSVPFGRESYSDMSDDQDDDALVGVVISAFRQRVLFGHPLP